MTFICSGLSVSSTRMRDVAEQLALETIAQVARRDVLAVPARHRRRVDAEDHRHRRLVDRDRRHRHAMFSGSAIVSPMVMSSMPARQTMSPAAACSISTRLRPSNANSFVTCVSLHDAVELHHGHRVVQTHRAVEDAADGDASEVVARIEVGDEHLQRRLRVAARRRHVLDDRVEQRPQVLAGDAGVGAGDALARVGVEHGKLDLVLGGVEVDEQVVDLVQHLLRPRVRRGRSCSARRSAAARARAPCAARTASAAAALPTRPPAASRRRPSTACARPRRRSRRGPGVSTMLIRRSW